MTAAPPAAPAVRFRNIDTIRLALATAVVFSHSFLIADRSEASEPLVQLLGKGNIAGLYGVFGFFVLSGFLITRSFEHRTSSRAYLTSRVLRIFPALIVVALVCAFVFGPVVTTLGPGDYLTDGGTYAFVVRTSALLNAGQLGLPGVEFSDTDIGHVVIGTLWTLLPEFLCYLAVLVAGLLGLLRLPLILLAIPVGLWTHAYDPHAVRQLGYLAVFFAAGSALYFIHERARPSHRAVGAAAVGFAACVAFGAAHEGFALFGSVLLIQLATTERVSLGYGARFGDLSYGVYLYGWPVQQTLEWAAGGAFTWWTLFPVSLAVSLALAWLSWHLVEKHALQLARRLRDRTLAAPVSAAAR